MPDPSELAMLKAGIHPERLHRLNSHPVRKGAYLIYWMQQAQRAHWNHALEYAILRANSARLPLIILFVLVDTFPEANRRHYVFMAQGICETAKALKKRGLRMVIRPGNPVSEVFKAAENAAEIICDMGYTRIQRNWRASIASSVPCAMTGVESDVVVPIETASSKAEYAARTLRPKIQKFLERFLQPVNALAPLISSDDMDLQSMDPENPEKLLTGLRIDPSAGPVDRFFSGGTTRAEALFEDFSTNHLHHYAQTSRQPQINGTSRMSPYLHFGQISPVYLAWRVHNAPDVPRDCRDAFMEELVVRRELSANFVHYTKLYDDYSCLPTWARKTLAEHAKDRRMHVYTLADMESGATHDPYWNAAMTEMKVSGFMHNYIRMYWGKKILEWSPSPESAFRSLLTLNNKYFLDGRDPNSFAGVGWIFGLHDRAWTERQVFGKIRYMNAAGLERKCDIQGYVQKIAGLKAKRERREGGGFP